MNGVHPKRTSGRRFSNLAGTRPLIRCRSCAHPAVAAGRGRCRSPPPATPPIFAGRRASLNSVGRVGWFQVSLARHQSQAAAHLFSLDHLRLVRSQCVLGCLQHRAQRAGHRHSTFFVWMHPLVRRNRTRFGQLDHAHRRRRSTFPAGPALQRGFQFPDRRIPRPADRVEWQARSGLAAITLDLEPAQPAIKTLSDRRSRLRGPSVAFHSDRPRFSLGTVRFSEALFAFSRAALAWMAAPIMRPPHITSRLLVLIA